MRIKGCGIAPGVICFTHRVKNAPKQANLTTKKRGEMKIESMQKFWKNASNVKKEILNKKEKLLGEWKGRLRKESRLRT
jgi:hypothetical protein